MATVAQLDVKIGADLKAFNKGMGSLQAGLQQAGAQARRLGKTFSLSLTAPIVALGAKSLQAFNQQQQALAQVEAAVKSTAGAAGFAVKELEAQAASLQRNTIFGDEQILKEVTANLLTFTRITGDEFVKTQGLVLDLATRMGTDLTSATLQLGKALNDPVANLGALGRAGIQFTKEQKEVIKSLVEGGKQAEAQRIILDELETQFGGAAEAAAQAGLGGLKQFQNALGDLLEQVGELLIPYLNDVVDVLSGVVEYFQGLSPETKKTALAIAGFAAAIGPALFILGGMASGLSAILSAMTMLTALANPVVLAFAAVAAIGVAVYRNWDAVKAAFVGTWDAISVLLDNLKSQFLTVFQGIFKAAAQAVTGDFSGAFETLKSTVSTGASNVVSEVNTFATDVGAAVAPAAAALMFDPLNISDLFSSDFVSGVTGGLSQIGSQATKSLSGNTDSVTSSAGEASKELESLVVSTGNVVTGVKGISDEVIKLEKVDPDFSLMEKAMGAEKGSVKAAADAAAESVKGIFSAIPTTLEMPDGYEDVIKSVVPDKDESHRWGKFVIGMDDLKEDLRDASHFSFTMSGYLGDIEESWRALFGTDSPKWMKDLSRYATDAGLIVQGLEAMVQLLTPSTWTNAFGVLKDLGGELGKILGFLIDIVLKIGEWIAAQVGFGGGGGGITIGGPGTGVPPVTVPGTSTTSAGGGGGLAGLLGGATVGATIGIFGYGLTQMLTDSMQSLLEQGLSEAQVGTAVSLGGLLQGLGSMGSGGTPSWLSGLQGYMGSSGAANTSGFIGGMGGLFGSGSSGSMGQTINVNLDGQTIATATVPYMANELEVFGTNY
jgi:hypothetical protein